MLHQKELLLKAKAHLINLPQKNLVKKIICQEDQGPQILQVATNEIQETDVNNASFFCFLLATFVK